MTNLLRQDLHAWEVYGPRRPAVIDEADVESLALAFIGGDVDRE